MKYKDLKATNPALDIEHLLDLVALYKGGKEFRARITRFLPQNEYEQSTRYTLRQQQAPYRSYVGPIIDKFAASLIASPPNAQVVDEAGSQSDPEEFWLAWRDNVDGNGTNLSEFTREQITDALMKKRAMWVVQLNSDGGPTPESMLEYKERGLGKIALKELETQDVLDWECDATGALLWLMHREVSCPRADPRTSSRNKVIETYTLYDRETTEVFTVEYEKDKPPPEDSEIVGVPTTHGLGQLPIVVFALPDGLWVAERVQDAQVEHFRLNAALSWAIKTTCYAMPVFKTVDNKPPVFGTGKGIQLDILDEIDWFAPPIQHLAVIAEKISTEKDEIYRVVHQMADGVNNNAGTAGRSAASKQIDSASLRVIMQSYSTIARDAIQRTYELAAALRGDKAVKWDISGLDEYAEIDLVALLEAASMTSGLGIPSETFQVHQFWLIVDSMLPNIDEDTRSKIHEEILAGIKIKMAREEEDRKHEVTTRETSAENDALLAHALNRSDPRGLGGSNKSKRPPNSKKNSGGGSGRAPAAAA